MQKTIIFIIVCISLVVLSFLGYQRWAFTGQPGTARAELQKTTVAKGKIVATVFVVGNVAPSREATLSFASPGTIASVDVAVGDSVEAGQIIATLDTQELERNVASAELNATIREAELAKLLSGPPEVDLVAAQAALKAAQDTLATLQAGANQTEIEAAQSAFKAAQSTYNLLTSDPDPKIIRQAELQVEFAKNSLWQAQSQRDAACGRDRASKSTCDAFQAMVGNAHVQIAQAELGLEKAKSSATEAEMQNALAQVQLAQRNLDNLLTGPNAAEIAAAEAQVSQAEAQLERLTATPPPEDLRILEARVDQAGLALLQAQQNLEGAFLRAPFSGVIAAVNYRVGDLVRREIPGITLVDLSELEMRVNVAEVDISQIQLGQQAEITLDALSEETIFGQVTGIAPAARSELGVVNYPVSIAMTSEDDRIKSGLTGNINIIVGQRDNALLVPNRAIRQSKGQHFVVLIEGEQLIETPVTIGLSNDTVTEIIRGVEEGTQVVLNPTAVQAGLDGNFLSP